MAFDHRKNRVLFLQLEQRRAEFTEKLSAGGFEQIEVARVLNVVAEGAFGVSHAMDVPENGGGHGEKCSGGRDKRKAGKRKAETSNIEKRRGTSGKRVEDRRCKMEKGEAESGKREILFRQRLRRTGAKTALWPLN